MKKKIKIVHISTVHSWQDPRIFHKQCKSLAEYGFEVHLITPDGVNEVNSGVHVHQSTCRPKNRLMRFLRAPKKLFRQALSLNPDLIHFHDPEIIPIALKYREKKQIPVIYDIHEDNTTAVLEREYLPSFLRPPIISVIKYYEERAEKKLHTIIAESYYQRRFPSAVPILNYPALGWMEEKSWGNTYDGVLYTGTVTQERGAFNHASILKHLDSLEVWSIGRCTTSLYNQMKTIAGTNADNLIARGIDGYVPFEEIISYYKSRNWLAGLAIFPYSEHMKEKQLTKFFEYMAAGIPIIYSKIKAWQELLEPLDVGIAVNPDNEQEVVDAINTLQEKPELHQKMGENGQRAVKERFSWKSQQDRLIDFYTSLVPQE